MSEVRVNNLSNENNTGGPTISGITTYSGRHFFVPPQGDTASRPEDCEPGSLRFNTDSAKLEYFRGNTIYQMRIIQVALPYQVSQRILADISLCHQKEPRQKDQRIASQDH